MTALTPGNAAGDRSKRRGVRRRDRTAISTGAGSICCRRKPVRQPMSGPSIGRYARFNTVARASSAPFAAQAEPSAAECRRGLNRGSIPSVRKIRKRPQGNSAETASATSLSPIAALRPSSPFPVLDAAPQTRRSFGKRALAGPAKTRELHRGKARSRPLDRVMYQPHRHHLETAT